MLSTTQHRAPHHQHDLQALAGSQIDDSIDAAYRLTLSKGGCTYSLHEGDMTPAGPDAGPLFAVAVVPERTVVTHGMPTRADIRQFVLTNLDLLTHPHYNIGTWFNTRRNQGVLDISVTVDDEETALRLARMNHQEAIYDLRNQREIFLTRRTKSPEEAPSRL